jgi:hypothetical protein
MGQEARARKGRCFMSKHTAGPWEITIQNSPLQPHPINRETAYKIDNEPKTEGLHPTEEQYANARLIAAAPELYQMLRLVRNKFANVLMDCQKEEIDKLLSKAEGVQ